VNRIAWTVALVVVLTSCDSSNHDTKPTSTMPTSTTTVGVASPSLPPGASSASLTFSGAAGLAGGLSAAEVTCSFPDVDGLRLSVFARAADPPVTYRISVGPDRVFIHVDTGAGATFRERNFEGTGVSGFDAGRGAHVDTKLSEAAATADIEPGSLGTITEVKGSIDCGDQTPGSSSITVTGETSTGGYDASRLDPVVVECYFASEQVTVIGVADAGDREVLLMISLSPTDGVSVEEAPTSGRPRSYASVPGSASLTADGGHADGDAVEKDSTSPHRLHVDGDAVCGTPIRS
jgi:hypothetical protein